jgi:hypothetical protein
MKGVEISMRLNTFLAVVLFALSVPTFAQNSGGEGNNTNCNGVGNVNSPCTGTGGNGGGGGNGDNGNGGGGGGAGGSGGNATTTVTVTSTGGNATANGGNAVANGGTASASGGNANNSFSVAEGAVTTNNTTNNTNAQHQNQSSSATIAIGNGGNIERPVATPNATTQSTNGGDTIGGNATAPFSNANYAENSSSVGDVTTTNTNNNTVSGGAGGEASANAVVESGAVQVSEGAFQSNYTYKEVQQAPAIGQGSFAIQGCAFAGNAGGSWTGGAAFLGFGWTTEQCYDFLLAQAYQSIGEKKAVCDILKNSKAGKRQEKRGIVLPDCLPEVKTVVVPVPVDLSPYATKEELNRAFKKSMEK